MQDYFSHTVVFSNSCEGGLKISFRYQTENKRVARERASSICDTSMDVITLCAVI